VKIERDVEIAVREAFAATVGGQRERFDAAVEAIGARGDDFANEAFRLAVAVSAVALYIDHNQEWPSPERIQELAQAYPLNESWSGVGFIEAKEILEALVKSRSPLERLSLGKFSFAIFAVGGWLLAAFDLPEGAAWNDFLDDIEHELESRSE